MMFKRFHGLRIAHKLTLVSVIFMLPDSIMLYLFITSINQNVHVARLEKIGNEYQRAVEPLLKLIPEHRLRTRADSTAGDVSTLKRLHADVDAAFDKLAEVDRRIGEELDFTPGGLAKRNREHCAVERVRADWETIKREAGPKLDPDLDAKHLRLTAAVRGMISHAGDTSNLILDPELDSYYMMDVTLLALPQTQDRIMQIMIDGVDRIRGESPAHDAKVRLAIDESWLRQADIDRIAASLQIALNNGNPDYGPNERLHKTIPPRLAKYRELTDRFAGTLARLQQAELPAISEAEFVAEGLAAREAAFDLWYAADHELDHLLQSRIEYFIARRTRSLAVAAGAAMAAGLLVMFITRSISGPLKKQADDLRQAYTEAQTARELAESRLAALQKAEAELRAAQDQLVTAGRHAGMAEVATGVLHNVGNVLNSVNVSVQLIKDKMQGSHVAKLAKAADLIEGHAAEPAYLTTDSRGKLLPAYVCKLAKTLESENAAVLTEVQNLCRGVEHIKQVVSFQQNYAKPSTLLESLDPAELIEDALRLHLVALDRHGVTIDRHFEPVGCVMIDKHKTLQILVNLLSNAKNAMKDLNQNQERRLSLRLTTAVGEDGPRVRIEVGDNGCGIAPEHLTRIFAHGFTTRAEGHGFGLHSAVNSAREMHGSLNVASAGPGCGATFTLDLPLTRSSSKAAA